MDSKLLQLSDKATSLGFNMFHDKNGYEFREQLGNKKFSVKNIDQGHIMLDVIARVPTVETTNEANHWLHLSKDTAIGTVELNAIARSVMLKIAGVIEPVTTPEYAKKLNM